MSEKIIPDEFFEKHGTTRTHISKLTGISSKILANQGNPTEETTKKIEAMKCVINRYDIFWPPVPPAFKDRAAYEVAVQDRDRIDAFFLKEFNKELEPKPIMEVIGWNYVEPSDGNNDVSSEEKKTDSKVILEKIKKNRPKAKGFREWLKAVRIGK